MSVSKMLNDKLLIGRTEWCQLGEFNIPAIKAKVDTGAQTSAIHALDIKPFKRGAHAYVSFAVTPIQGNDQQLIYCQAPIIDQRYVMSSNGHREDRFVIATPLTIAGQSWDIELTLSNRDPLRYRMLLGCEALRGRVVIDPHLECHQGKMSKTKLLKLYESLANNNP